MSVFYPPLPFIQKGKLKFFTLLNLIKKISKIYPLGKGQLFTLRVFKIFFTFLIRLTLTLPQTELGWGFQGYKKV